MWRAANAPAPLPLGPKPPASPTSTPSFASPTEVAQNAVAQVRCEKGDSSICGVMYEWTGNHTFGQVTEVLVGTPLRILMVVLGALFLRFLLHQAIGRVTERIALGKPGLGKLDELPGAATVLTVGPLGSQRMTQRARTLGTVLKSLTTGVIGVVTVLMIMGDLGYPLSPLIASAGILGVALGFGAQTLVRDFLSGVFMIIEDQYGVGDAVDLGEASGTVETVGLRVTKVRDVEGTLWHVRNGEIVRVGNKSQGWARAVLDVEIAYGEDVDRVKALLVDVARQVREDEAFAPLILEDAEMWGVESASSDGIVLRLVVKTRPLEQWTVAREMRRRIKERFDEEDVQVPPPMRGLWLQGNGPGGQGPAANGPPAP